MKRVQLASWHGKKDCEEVNSRKPLGTNWGTELTTFRGSWGQPFLSRWLIAGWRVPQWGAVEEAVLEAGTSHNNEEPFRYQLGHTIPEREGSKLLSPHSRMLSLIPLSWTHPGTPFDVSNYKYTTYNLACVSFFGKVITLITSIRGRVMIVKTLEVNAFLPSKRSSIWYYISYQEYNLTNFGCFPLYAISSLLTWVIVLIKSVANITL